MPRTKLAGKGKKNIKLPKSDGFIPTAPGPRRSVAAEGRPQAKSVGGIVGVPLDHEEDENQDDEDKNTLSTNINGPIIGESRKSKVARNIMNKYSPFLGGDAEKLTRGESKLVKVASVGANVFSNQNQNQMGGGDTTQQPLSLDVDSVENAQDNMNNTAHNEDGNTANSGPATKNPVPGGTKGKVYGSFRPERGEVNSRKSVVHEVAAAMAKKKCQDMAVVISSDGPKKKSKSGDKEKGEGRGTK